LHKVTSQGASANQQKVRAGPGEKASTNKPVMTD
jgi:hypothetical protein